MKLQAFLFLLYLFIFSDTVSCFISGYQLWNIGHGMVRVFAACMFAESLSNIGVFVASAFGFEVRPVYTLGYAWSYWATRAVLSATNWWLVLALVKGVKNDKTGV